MPSLFNTTPGADLDAQNQTAETAPYSGFEHTGEVFGEAFDPRPVGHFVADLFRPQGPKAAFLPGETYTPPLDPETANARYGVPGVLRFNKPVYDYDAAFQQHMALERQHRDLVLAHSNPQPLTDFGAGLVGSLVNPANLPVMLATGGLGEAAMGAVGLARGAEGAAVGTLGQIANAARVPLEGAVSNLPFVGVNAAAHAAAGDDYDMGDALRDVAAGAVLHSAAHVAYRGLPALFRRGGSALDPDAPADPNAVDPTAIRPALEPDPAPAAGVPPEVDALGPDARRGAFVNAVEDLSAGRPVDVGGLIQRELDTRADAAETERPPAPDTPPSPTIEAGDPIPAQPEPANEAASILAETNRRFAAGDAGDLETLRPPGRTDGSAADRGAGVQPEGQAVGSDNLGRPGGDGGGAGSGDARAAGSGAEDLSGRGDQSVSPKIDPRALIAADPALKALADDTARYAAENGVAEPAPAAEPKPILEAIQAATQCLLGAAEEIF